MGVLVMSSCSKATAPAATTTSVPAASAVVPTSASATQTPLISTTTPTSIPTSTPVPTPALTPTLTSTSTPTPTLPPTPTPTPTLTPTSTPTPTLTTTQTPAPTGVIPWDQALKLTCRGQTITVTGKVYEVLKLYSGGVLPSFALSLGALEGKGFIVLLPSDLTKFPADLTAAYVGKTIEATGIFYNYETGTAGIGIDVTDQSQIKVIE